MNIKELQYLSTVFGVRAITEEYRFMHLAVKVVGEREDTEKFLKAMKENLPVFVSVYSVSSKFEPLAEIKFLLLKRAAGLRKKDRHSINLLYPRRTLKPGVYVRYTE